MAITKWSLDPTHSEVQFKVRHMMISNVTGQFKQFSAELQTDGEDMSATKVHFTAEVDSISTNNDQRDGHLKNEDFFDAANHPQIVFDADKLEKTGDNEYKAHGNLTMRGVTKPISLNVEHGGVIQDPWGNTRTGFTVTGKISRKDFGVSFSPVSETGGIMLGDEITVNAAAEFVKQQEMQPA